MLTYFHLHLPKAEMWQTLTRDVSPCSHSFNHQSSREWLEGIPGHGFIVSIPGLAHVNRWVGHALESIQTAYRRHGVDRPKEISHIHLLHSISCLINSCSSSMMGDPFLVISATLCRHRRTNLTTLNLNHDPDVVISSVALYLQT